MLRPLRRGEAKIGGDLVHPADFAGSEMRRTSASAGMKRVHMASIRNSFFARASATLPASRRFSVNAFSHSTPLPA